MSGKTLGALAVGLLVVVGLFLVLNRNPQTPQQTQTTLTEEVANETVEIGEDADMEEATITYTANGFTPQNMTVEVGTKVIWVNNSGAGMQVSSSPHPLHTDNPEMNQKVVGDGESVSFVFEEGGTYRYHNHLNAKNTGSIVVE